MSNYQDRLLIDYLPTVLKDTREFQAIMQSEQPEIFDLFNEIQIALDNQFIQTLTTYGVERWEKILHIVPKITFSLEERKFSIQSLLSKQLPYTIRMLEKWLIELCGDNAVAMEFNDDDQTLSVFVAIIGKNRLTDVETMLRKICPASLVIKVSLLYNTWGCVKNLTWGELVSKTWKDIKDEVI